MEGDPCLFYLCWHWTPLYRRSFLNPYNPYNTQLIAAVMIIFVLRRLMGWGKRLTINYIASHPQ